MKSVPLCLLSAAFELLPETYNISNGDVKVLVENHKDKVFPTIFR